MKFIKHPDRNVQINCERIDMIGITDSNKVAIMFGIPYGQFNFTVDCETETYAKTLCNGIINCIGNDNVQLIDTAALLNLIKKGLK